MSKELLGKTVWITGGGSGIGSAMAIEFAARGAKVVVSGRRLDRLEEVVQTIVGSGGSAWALACDVNDEQEAHKAVAQIVARNGALDIAVANAGFSVSGKVIELSMDDWRRQFETNVFGLLHTVRAAVPELKKTKGRLALMGSVASYVSAPNSGAYNSSKYAMRSIGETLWGELAGTGVTCTNIHPGFVESEIAQVDNSGVFHSDRIDRRPAKLMWPADKAARIMVRAVERRKPEVIVTGHGKLIVLLVRFVPGLVRMLVPRVKT